MDMATTPLVACVVGARPNFMKMAPILRAFAAHRPAIRSLLVHTGQHYDAAMSDQLFTDLELPAPDVNLGVGSGTHAVQTAEIMKRFEAVLDQHPIRAVLVVGDVNSTIACALVAAKRGIAVIHVEAGLRSRDRSMPEEINRVLTDQISDVLYTTERSALANLAREGIDAARVQFVGNVMIDSLLASRQRAPRGHAILVAHGADAARLTRGYGLVTLHRPSNVDARDTLQPIVRALAEISRRLPLAFAVHPRTRSRLTEFGLMALLEQAGVWLLPPQGYLDMVGLMSDARVVLTDSGGMQEETTALGVPCLTVRDNTERPITLTEGSNRLVGSDAVRLLKAFDDVMDEPPRATRVPEGWDGCAAQRIAAHLAGWLVPQSVPA